jgi:hypothetical protein
MHQRPAPETKATAHRRLAMRGTTSGHPARPVAAVSWDDPSVIVWINGPFGVGKSTVAELLARRRPGTIMFDPEHLGFLVRHWQPPDVPADDFQHLSVWRRLVKEAAGGLIRDFGRPLIVPMTLLNPDYFDEIVGGLRDDGVDVRHFCLTADRGEVLRRVGGRGDEIEWSARKYDEYAGAMADDRFATHLDAVALDAETITATIDASLD